MGEIATHVIFYQSYWHLVFEEDGQWGGARGDGVICNVGQEEKWIVLNTRIP